VAVVGTIVLVGAMVTSSGAQQLYEKSITAECNPTTGDYDVTVTLSDAPDAPFLLTDTEYEYTTPDGHVGPLETAFDPSTMPVGGSTSVEVSIPGDSSDVLVSWYIREIDDIDSAGLELAGDCVAEEPTSTTAESSTSTSTSATEAVAAATVQPRFTG
jgi:hypothetical protein